MNNINRNIFVAGNYKEINYFKYFTIEALEDGLTAKLSVNDCEYSLDGSTWTTLAANTNTVSTNKGQILYFRGNLTPTSSSGIGTFTISKKCNIKGNIMSLLYGDDFIDKTDLTGKNYVFYKLFYNCTNIVDASKLVLPATTLADNCYNRMFASCTSLTEAPQLPATTLASDCYAYMFVGCGNLTTAPQLPATTLAANCYFDMFASCTSLTEAPKLPATTLAYGCYQYMFASCTSLTEAPQLPATTLTSSCYSYMFYNCTGLITAPELPATILASSCYNSMFEGCTSLTAAPALPANTLADSCYSNMFEDCTSLIEAPQLPITTLGRRCYESMFEGCTSLTSAPELPATTLASNCYSKMFQNCTSLTTAPELSATTLADYCYKYMFQNCSKLNYIKMLATNISASSCLSYWVNNVASSGTFIKNADMTSLPSGIDGIPKRWTVKDNFYPVECISLSITADNVSGRATTTKIYYTAELYGYDDNNNYITITKTGETVSEEFPQNTSETETVTRTISYTYMGVTATTTIIQDVWVNSRYTVNLNSNWQLSTAVNNPDSNTYDGVYESYSNYNVDNRVATMYIDIEGYTDFKLYIRSYAESNYDYVMVSQPDKTITGSTSYSDTTLIKAHTRGSQNSGTSISSYKLVEFTGMTADPHRITIVYRKDGGSHSGTDKGYVLIPKNQAS